MDEFDRITDNLEPDYHELKTAHIQPGRDQAWKALAAAINAATICATFWFRSPDEHRDLLVGVAGEPVDTAQRWRDIIEAIGGAS